MAQATKKFDVHQHVTDRIIAALEANDVPPWVRPWRSRGIENGTPYNAVSKRPYSGVNVLLLWIEALEKDYQHTGWLTFKQAQKLGGSVRKGEKSTTIVFWSTISVVEENDDGDETQVERGFMKAYRVFNVEQCEGLPDRIAGHTVNDQLTVEGNDDPGFDAWLARTGAIVRHGKEQAAYLPATDVIHMPDRERFQKASGYNCVALHELGHWTGAKHRLNRGELVTGIYKKPDYAFEELVAELCSSFMCAEMSIDHDLHQTAAYLKSWLRALKDDKKFVFKAASHASKAAAFLNEQVEANTNAKSAA